MQVIDTKRAEYDKWVQVNSTDAYSQACVTYATRWADMMEAAIAQGGKLEDVAQRLSHEADKEGITGFMYGAACSALAHFWVHGQQLRVWHNAQYGVSEEQAKGGTVNPAIMTIGEQP